MEIDKIHTIPARRPASPKNEERRKGLCHLCKGQGHIQRFCPRKVPEPPARMASAQTAPLVSDQGVKRPRSPAINRDEVLCYLKKTTLKNRDDVAAGLMKTMACQDFSCA